MKFKKMMSAVLAGAMALSMTATALASNQTLSDISEGAELELTSVTQGATIKVTVPTSVIIGLNPYEMEVELNGGKLVDKTGTAGAQVLSAVYAIKNESSLPIDVGVSVTATAEGVTLLTSGTTIPSTDTTKSAIVTMNYVPGQPSATELTALPSGGGTPTKLTLDTAAEVKSTKDVTLTVPNATTPTSSNLYFTFDGKLNKKAATAWTADDIIGATIAFTFKINTK